MNTQKAPTSTAASAPPPPKPTAAPRNGKAQAPFSPFAPSTPPPGGPAAAEPTDALSLLEKWMSAAPSVALTAGAVPRALQPPSDAATDAKGQARGGGLLGDSDEPRARLRAHDDPLDPMTRQTAQLGPPLSATPLTPTTTPDAAVAARAMTSLEELLPQLVRKIAWSGDGKRGAVRMELGAGALAGSTLMLESEGGRVRVHLDTAPGVDGEGWKQRIGARLAEKNIDVESIEVQ